MLRIKQFFCKHDMKVEKHFEPTDYVHIPCIDCFYYVCQKCNYVDKNQMGHQWSRYYLDGCKERGQKWIISLKWTLEGEPPCAQ